MKNICIRTSEGDVYYIAVRNVVPDGDIDQLVGAHDPEAISWWPQEQASPRTLMLEKERYEFKLLQEWKAFLKS